MCFFNNSRIRVTKKNKLKNSILVTVDLNLIALKKMIFFKNILMFKFIEATIRKFGSAALELSYVAAGRFDAYWEWELNLWDIAAG